jgi:vancomycin aglycone glucosyltransferase
VARAVLAPAFGVEVQACAPTDHRCAEALDGVGVPLVPIGQLVRPPLSNAIWPSAADLPPRTVDECDAPPAPGVMPAGGWR